MPFCHALLSHNDDFRLHFLNSHQDICLRVEAILNPGSAEWWCETIPKETKWTRSGVLKEIQTNNAGLRLKKLPSLSESQTPKSPQDTSLPNPRAKTSPVIVHESQSRYHRKLYLSAKALMRWQMKPQLPAGSSGSWWKGKCWGAAEEQFLEGFLWPWKGLYCDSHCICVTFSSQTKRHPVLWVTWSKQNSQHRGAAEGQQTQIDQWNIS